MVRVKRLGYMAKAIDVANEALKMAMEALKAIEGHEKVCIEKHNQIAKNQADAKEERNRMHVENKQKIDRLWNLTLSSGGAIILFLATILWEVLKK